MLCLLSPAKTLDLTSPTVTVQPSTPALLAETTNLLGSVQGLTTANIKSLMSLSDNLAQKTAQQFQSFATAPDPEHTHPAILTFAGEVYRGFDGRSMSRAELDYAQNHVAILSGLYGLLRALDGMQPYRLEMGTRLPTERGVGLYPYWGERITQQINAMTQSHADRTVINLASKEYSRAVKPRKLDSPMVTVDFKEQRDGKLKTVAVYAKRARGTMARHIVKNQLSTPEDIKAATPMGYRFDAAHSTAQTWTFIR